MVTHSIPKIIHYVWVGEAKQPALIRKCIESWKKFAPEYEIHFWNEENSPMNHPYVQIMYKKKKWAFVSDYIRFWALEKEGGVYLDTDMELLKPLDNLLEHEVFLGRAKSGHASAGIIGSVPHHIFLQKVLEFYDTDTSFSTANTSPLIIEKILTGFHSDSIVIYEPKYFYPCNADEKCTEAKCVDAYTTHHWAESWVPFKNIRKFLRKIGALALYKKIIPNKTLRIGNKFPVVRLLQLRDNPAFIWHYLKRFFYYKVVSDTYIPLYREYTFLNSKDTLSYLLSHRISLARFSDGEIEQLTGAGIYQPNSDWSQRNSKGLQTRLKEAMISDNENLFIAHTSPDLFLKNKKEAKDTTVFHNMWVDTRVFLHNYLSKDRIYGDAHVFMPSNNPDLDWDALNTFLAGKNILIVTGGTHTLQHLKLGKRTFFIEAGKHDAFNRHQEISEQIRDFFIQHSLSKEDTLIMISLGPTAGIIAFDLSKEGFHIWDTGHFFKFIHNHNHVAAPRAKEKST